MKLYQSSKVQTKSFQSQNSTSLVLKIVQIFLHQWTNCPSATLSLFETTNSSKTEYFYTSELSKISIWYVLFKNQPETAIKSLCPKAIFLCYFILLIQFVLQWKKMLKQSTSLLKSRTWILTSSVSLQFYFESSLIKDCIIHLILWLSFYDFIINTLTYLFKTAI